MKMCKLIIRFKDGFELHVVCESYAFNREPLSNKIISWEFNGIVGPAPVFIDVREIECIIRDNTWEEDSDPDK